MRSRLTVKRSGRALNPCCPGLIDAPGGLVEATAPRTEARMSASDGPLEPAAVARREIQPGLTVRIADPQALHQATEVYGDAIDRVFSGAELPACEHPRVPRRLSSGHQAAGHLRVRLSSRSAPLLPVRHKPPGVSPVGGGLVALLGMRNQ
jgi:hypothetical protein